MAYKLPSLFLLLATSLTATSASPLNRRQEDSSTQSANAAYTWKGKSNGFEAKFYQTDDGNGTVANDDFKTFVSDLNTQYVQPIVKDVPDWKRTDRIWPNKTFTYETDKVVVEMAAVNPDPAQDPFTVAEMVAFTSLLKDFAGSIEGDFSTAEVTISNTPEGKSTAHGTVLAKGVAEVDPTPTPSDVQN